jgi:hypothetical protein
LDKIPAVLEIIGLILLELVSMANWELKRLSIMESLSSMFSIVEGRDVRKKMICMAIDACKDCVSILHYPSDGALESYQA